MFKNLVPWKKGHGVKVRREGELVDDNGHHHYPMAEFRRQMDRLWDRFWDDWSEWDGGPFGGHVAWEERDQEYVLHAELPGFAPEDIDVKISGNTMTVRAERGAESDSSYHYGEFFETFTLPAGVDTDRVDARFQNGLLELHLPRNEDSKARRITVQSA